MKNNKVILKLLKPLFWVFTKLLGLIPSYGNVIKAINCEREVSRLEKLGKHEEARKLRTKVLNRHPAKHLGPLWRSEGMDQLYNLKNYEEALEAFEKAINCIEGDSMICAFQYGVTQPISVYYGAASSAIYLSDKIKANVYYQNFFKLSSHSSNKEQYQEHLVWLRTQIDESKPQTDFTN